MIKTPTFFLSSLLSLSLTKAASVVRNVLTPLGFCSLLLGLLDSFCYFNTYCKAFSSSSTWNLHLRILLNGFEGIQEKSIEAFFHFRR